MQDHAVTDSHTIFQKDVGMNHTIVADPDLVADFRPRANLRSRSDAGILADTYEGADKDFESDIGAGSDNRGGVNLGIALFWRM